jgi:hypothetical protein
MLWSVLLAGSVAAAAAYVSDELILGVYAAEDGQGQRLTTLRSGAAVDALGVKGDFTQVRLKDGTTGWVKSNYLTTTEPATSRIKRLEEELDRSRATSPALAEAAAQSEVSQLKRELADRISELEAARAGVPASAAGAAPAPHRVFWVMVALLAAAGGFLLGYATLARRIKRKFGGLKVY